MLNLTAIEDDGERTFLIDLYTNYYGFVKKTVYGIIREHRDIEDLIDDVYLKLIEKVAVLKTLNKNRAITYMYYTAKSVAINFIARRDVMSRHILLGLEDDFSSSFAASDEGMEERILYQSELESLGSAIMKLPQNQKDLLNYKYLLNMSDAEIGETLGIEASSVREYLTRARRSARELIEKEMSPHG